MIEDLVLVWQNPKSRSWIPVGRLQCRNNKYIFSYTVCAKNDTDFVPFGRMTDLDISYESDELFPIFKNRLLAKSRPEYSDYLDWLDLGEEGATSFEELARTRGLRATDSLQVFLVPKESNGMYEVTFFSHGVRHLTPHNIDRINHLNYENKLYLLKDIQNEFDSLALVLRTGDPPEIVGYCPRFFVNDFTRLIEINGPENVTVSVVKVNVSSPLQFKLLCKYSTPWPSDFIAFGDENFQPLCK